MRTGSRSPDVRSTLMAITSPAPPVKCHVSAIPALSVPLVVCPYVSPLPCACAQVIVNRARTDPSTAIHHLSRLNGRICRISTPVCRLENDNTSRSLIHASSQDFYQTVTQFVGAGFQVWTYCGA